MKKLIPQNLKNIYHLFQAILANLWFGFPSRKIKVIGITGTDGKTTTTQMVAKILEGADRKVAMASTINFKINEKEWTNLSHFTTLSAFEVQKFIRQAVNSGCEYLVLETSSHSLDQYRVWGIDYETAVITNVTREHLDYHKNMENYRQAKRGLFDKVETAIVNLDMEKPEEYLSCKAKTKLGFTTSISNFNPLAGGQISNQFLNSNDKIKKIIAENIELRIDGSTFNVEGQKFILNLVGDFNIENALAAISVGISENIDLESCARSLEKIKEVSGRMEYVPNKKGLNILVDFALTPEALKKLYSLLVKIKKPEAKVIAVFGACGERDRGKRPIIGEIVSDYADFIILTNDEPYRENPENIINEIFKGVVGDKFEKDMPEFQISNFKFPMNDKIPNEKKEGINCWRILERREAIRFALEIAQPDDIIAVTGMGAEESMVVGDKKIPWNDRAVILEELEK